VSRHKRAGQLALVISRQLLRQGADAAEAQAALMIALRQAKAAAIEHPHVGEEAMQLEREFFDQVDNDERNAQRPMRLVPCETHRVALASLARSIQATTTPEALRAAAAAQDPLKREIRECRDCKHAEGQP
jgi:hypothetical protein